MDQKNRIVVLIDMDCFYCQVEEKLNPEIKGKPVAVVQYNPWKGGGIIAVNYEARAKGVTRHMRGDEAKEKCPEINLPSVPCFRDKADTTRYRDAGKEVAKVLQRFTTLLERASVDEAYLDITTSVETRIKSLDIHSISADMIPNTYALGYDNLQKFIDDLDNYGNECIDYDLEHSRLLLIGAVIVSEIRAAVFNETGYRCSAGIAHNKILAKLVCGMNKPNKQTILPMHSVNILFRTLPVKKVKHLGGKFGNHVCDTLKITSMGDLEKFTEKQLQAKFDDKNGTWLYNIARGIDNEPVQAKFNSKSIGCCKQLRGKSALTDLNSLKNWLKDLSDEIEDRLEKDSIETNRMPKQMVVSFTAQLPNGRDVNSSRSHNFTCDEEICSEFIVSKALDLILDSTESAKHKENEPNRKLKTTIKFLAISVGKFEDRDDSRKAKKIVDFFSVGTSKSNKMSYNDPVGNIDMDTSASIDKDSHKNDYKYKEGKQYLLKKFLQGSDKEMNVELTHEVNKKITEQQDESTHQSVAQSSLQKQELFFQRFLNSNLSKNEDSSYSSTRENVKAEKKDNSKSPTLDCNIVEHGSESNDSTYTCSTINMEINKSISLFEDDPIETVRISSMRNFLGSSVHFVNTEIPKTFTETSTLNKQQVNNTICCPDCKKLIPTKDFDTHSDYHVALKLRNEDRKDKQMEKKKVTPASEPVMQSKMINNDSIPITNFLVKFDRTVPLETCSICRKKIPIESITEHLDFHEAQKLSRELNKKSTILDTSSAMKRKHKTISPVHQQKVLCRTIDSFFR